MALKNLTESLLLAASQTWFSKVPLTQTELAAALASVNIIKTPQVIHTLSQVDRKLFTTDPEPYANKPCPVGHGEVITSPSTHGLILEILYTPLQNSSKVLDLGCGLGYISQCMALLNPQSQIIAVDIHKALINKAKDLNKLKNIEFRHCEAHELVEDQFDTINVGFDASPELFEQLCWKVGKGKVLCPVSGKWIFFDGTEKIELGEVGFSKMRVLENLEEELGEVEKEIKDVYLELQRKLGRRPNVTELPSEVHVLVNKRRRIQNRIRTREMRMMGKDE